jgi:signal transduction histidine kinase
VRQPENSIHQVLFHLTQSANRLSAIAELTKLLHCDQIWLLIEDEEIGQLLPAPGFAQTMAGRREWIARIRECSVPGMFRAMLPTPLSKAPVSALIFRPADHCALVLLGGCPQPQVLERLGPAVATVGAALQQEHMVRVRTAEMQVLQKSASESAELARMLDRTRNELRETVDALLKQTSHLTELNTDLQRFSYVISHDLQEPIRMMGIYADLLRRRYGNLLDSDADEFIGYIVTGARRIKLIVDDVLDYARAGDVELHRLARVSLEHALAVAQSNLRLLIEETGAVITHSELPAISGNELQIVRLFQNLLSNAIKYRTDQPPEIHVEATRNENEWLISMSDNGVGVDPLYAEHVFEMFKRLDTAGTPGTGIGLTICRRIVERHGGRIWIEQALPNGTRVCFTLPSGEK